MFDMKRNAGDDAGYQIRITYHANIKMYTVTGYIICDGKEREQYEYERDGAVRYFETMDEAMAFLGAYPKDENREAAIDDLLSGASEMP